jgi:hypothetical protein
MKSGVENDLNVSYQMLGDEERMYLQLCTL